MFSLSKYAQYHLTHANEALLYYDYSLTWTREVKYFWMRRFTLSTALYIACRYALVTNVLYTLAISNKLNTLRVRFMSAVVCLPDISSILLVRF